MAGTRAGGEREGGGGLGSLPPHYRRERERLRQAGIDDWPGLAALDDGALRRLAGSGAAGESALRRLRGQARLVVEVGLAPEQAALLLHAGIADRDGLARAAPEVLHRQVGRLQRRLTGAAVSPPDLATLQEWIRRAARGSGRSGN